MQLKRFMKKVDQIFVVGLTAIGLEQPTCRQEPPTSTMAQRSVLALLPSAMFH
jgi:hypothetical protein